MMKSPNPPRSSLLYQNKNRINGGRNSPPVEISPAAREQAKKRAAISVVRAAIALHKSADFESLPPQAQRVTRAMVSDEEHFLEAIEELNRTNASFASEDFPASLNNTATYSNTKTFGTMKGLTSTARPLSATMTRPGRNSMTVTNNKSPPRGRNSDANQFIAGAFGDNRPSPQRGQQLTSPDSTLRMASTISPQRSSPSPPPNIKNRRLAALGLRSSPSRNRSPSRVAAGGNGSPGGSASSPWSPKRPPQVSPTSINLQQVINEIKLRIPAMRRAIAATPSQTPDLRQMGDNMSRIFTLIDAKNASEVSLQEIAAFGKRIGGSTQQLFRMAEMRARLHYRFPREYPSPLVIYAQENEDLFHLHQQQQQHHHHQPLEGTALFLEATNNFNASMTLPRHSIPVAAIADQNHLQVSTNPAAGSLHSSFIGAPPVNSFSATPASAPHQHISIISHNNNSNNIHPPPSSAGGRTPGAKLNVTVRTPNPYEDPISRDVFIDAVISASNHKWAAQAPAILSRPSSMLGKRKLQRSNSNVTTTSGTSTKNTSPSRAVSEVNTTGGGGQATRSALKTTPRAPPIDFLSPSSANKRKQQQNTGVLNRESSSNVTTSSSQNHNTALQRTTSNISSSGAGNMSSSRNSSPANSSINPSFSSNPLATAAVAAAGTTTTSTNSNANTTPQQAPSLVGGRKSYIPTDPEQRASFFRVVRIVDPNNTGYVTLDNLLMAIPRTASIDAIVAPQFSTKSLFEKHDIDGDNKLTVEEFADMFKDSFVPDQLNLKEMLRKIEEGNDGTSAGDKLTQARAVLAAAEEKKKELDFSYKGRRVNWNKSAAAGSGSGGTAGAGAGIYSKKAGSRGITAKK